MPDDYFWSKEYSWPTLYNNAYLQSAEEPIKFFQEKKNKESN